AAFVSLSLIPTLLLFSFSVAFISDSIENWFTVPIESSLKEALDISQSYYDDRSAGAIYQAVQVSKKIKERKLINKKRLNSLRWYLKAKAVEYNLGSVEVFSTQKEELVKVIHPDLSKEIFSFTESSLVSDGLLGKKNSVIQSVGQGDVIRGVAPIFSTWKEDDVVGATVVSYYIPHNIVSKMSDIRDAFQEYKQLKIVKNPIKINYLMTLLMVTLIIIFAAIWFGLYLAKDITIPIQQLAEGTEEVANGNLDFTIDLESGDEIGTLVSSFNAMTKDLKVSKSTLETTNLDLENRRRYIEIILKGVAAGVISVDKLGKISTINQSAEQMIGVKGEDILGKSYKEVADKSYLDLIKNLVKDAFAAGGTIEKETNLSLRGENVTLLVSLSVLRDEKNNYLGMVLVFDDLTELIKGQRAATWREVARRIAHEIKNPLTPIQLSAQRLRKKFGDKVDDSEGIFTECTSTIIRQVDELKELVNEFSSFARLPAATPVPSNIGDIVQEAVSLYKEAHKDIEIRSHMDEDLPTLNLDRNQIKRVFINLLENAVEALNGDGVIDVSGSYKKESDLVRVEVADNGQGIEDKNKARLFEPYFSTKRGGTGLGLAIVDTIMKDHKGSIRVRDNRPKGTKFMLEFPI
ncbi:MAG: HAMP domain-containing protein, partial [Proteobacteria bacterium]|nr:HAMP domain-containing protein [Pseudomonadota bacterium]